MNDPETMDPYGSQNPPVDPEKQKIIQNLTRTGEVWLAQDYSVDFICDRFIEQGHAHGAVREVRQRLEGKT